MLRSIKVGVDVQALVGTAAGGAVNGVVGVDLAGALLEDAVG
jgi:hypothetical protein